MRIGALIRVLPNEGFGDVLDNKLGLVLGPSGHSLYPFKVLVEECEYFLDGTEMEEVQSDD